MAQKTSLAQLDVLISLARAPSLTATEASEAEPLAGPFPSRQAGNRQVAISLARGMLFREPKKNSMHSTEFVLNLSCERNAFQGNEKRKY